MKKSFQLFFGAALVLMSCEQLKEDKIRAFIPGVYVKAIDHEFAKGMDTIAISILDKNAGTYVVSKKSGYQQKIAGKLFSPKYEPPKGTATDGKHFKQLHIPQKEKTYNFLPEENKLLSGSSEYKKISK